MMDQLEIQRLLNQKKGQLRTLQEKFQLNNKKIKLLRKQNQEMKNNIERNSQNDTNLLLHSKQLSDANSKLQATIQELQHKMNEPVQAPAPQIITIKDLSITNQTLEVDLANKGLIDQDITQIQAFTKIQSLILDNNELTDTSLNLICVSLKNLKKLLFNVNKISVDGVKNIGQLKQIKSIQLANNNLGDQSIKFIIELAPTLQELSLPKNQLTDSGSYLLPKLQNLLYLDITNNSLTDEGAKDITELKKLTHLYIGWNKLTGLGVRWIMKDLKFLEALDVRFNTIDKDDKQKLRADRPSKLQIFC